MRILYFSKDYTTHDYRFLSALAKTEHHIGFLRLERGKQVLEKRSLPREIEIIPWAGGKRSQRIIDIPNLLRSLKRVIKKFHPDIIQAGPVQRTAFLVALTGFEPLLTMSWGYDLLVDANRNRLWQWITSYTLKRSAVLVGDCETIRRRAVSFGMRPDRIITFPWGADINRYSPGDDGGLRKQLGWGDDVFVLLSTRSWEPIYGVVDLVKAFIFAAQKRPELRLLLLGGGSEDIEIHRLINSAGVGDKVKYAGLISQEELPRYYRAADIYVSASYSDGTSISLLEALATGLPAIVSDIPGNREWITPGQEGWLFSVGDPETLVNAIVYANDHRSQLLTMGRKARLLAEQRGNWEENFPKLLDAFAIAMND